MSPTAPEAPGRPPSVDRLAREIAQAIHLPHAICVDLARQAISESDGRFNIEAALRLGASFKQALLAPVINATGVLLHTNLGRAPYEFVHNRQALNVEFNLASGERGSRQTAVGDLFARLCGAEAAMVVNNNAAAVLLVVAALAHDRDVLVSRGESVEIGGGFRVPEVIEQSGARLVDIGTTNRTRLGDYRKALASRKHDVALVLKVHPSNYRVAGFVEDTSVKELATLAVPVVADIGSGLIDSTCPWLPGAPPTWLGDEPAARQTVADGAAVVTFSGDKLLGGPQAGIIVGRSDLIDACKRHPLARALRPGGHVLLALQQVALSYLDRTVVEDIPFWAMASATVNELSVRAHQIVTEAGCGEVTATDAIPGAGSAPGFTIPSVGIALAGNHLAALRAAQPPIIARSRDGAVVIDLRTVDADDDPLIVEALRTCGS